MNERYEREIDDLLHRLEGRMKREPLSRRLSRKLRPYSQGFRGAFGAFLRRSPAEQFMIAGMLLVVVSFLLNLPAIPSLSLWAFYTSVLSVVLFLGGIALSIAGRHSPGYGQTRRWRGREIDYHHTGPNLWTALRNWFRRRRRL